MRKFEYVRLIIGLTLSTVATAQSEQSPRSVPAHTVPVPATVSPEMQKRIAQPDTPWHEKFPTTNKGWTEFGSADPSATNAAIDAALKRTDVTLEERDCGGVRCFEARPRVVPASHAKHLLVHIHGGGYVMGGGRAGTMEAILVAGTTHIKTISIDYRMPPEHPYPQPIDDVVSAWRDILAKHGGYSVGLFGTSTGGAMVLSLTQRAIAEGLPLPAAVVSGTPWSDLSETGDSYQTNKYLDPMPYRILVEAARQYADGRDLKDPRLSPVYGNFAKFPPTMLLTGTRDLFLSNTLRVDRRLRDAGRTSELIIYEGQSHGGYLSGLDFPETHTALADIAGFFDKYLGR